MLYKSHLKCISFLFALFAYFYSLNLYSINFINSGPPFENIEKIGQHDLANLTHLMQDNLGFLWLGNEDVLLRFDGAELKNFPLTEHIDDLKISSVIEGESGRIWIANSKLGKELGVFDRKTSKLRFINIQERLGVNLGTNLEKKPAPEIVYKNKRLYAVLGQQLLIIDEASFSLEQIITLPIADNDYVIRISVTKNGDIWFSSLHGKGVTRIDKAGIRSYKHQPDDNTTISADLVFHIFEDSKGRLWFSSVAGLDLYQEDSDSFKHYQPIMSGTHSSISHAERANVLLNIVEDGNGNLWLALMNSGLVKFQPELEIFEHYRHFNNVNSTISTDSLYWGGVFIDRQQTLWISTINGLSKLTQQARNIQLWENIDEKDCFPKKAQQVKKGFLFACGKAVYEYKNNQIDHVTTIPHLIESIYQGGDNFIWLGTIGGGIYRYDLSAKQTKQYGLNHDTDGTKTTHIIEVIRPDVNGNIYAISQKLPVTKQSGLLRYNLENDQFSHFETNIDIAITELVDVDKSRMLLIGGYSSISKQLYWFNKDEQTIEQLPIATGMVYAAIKWHDELWVSTENLGLINININSGQWQQVVQKAKYKISSLYLNADVLFMNINQDLYQLISVTNGKLIKRCITCALPVSALQISHPSHGQVRTEHGVLMSNDEFIVSAENSLMAFSVNEESNKKSALELVLTDYKVMGKSVLPEPNKEDALLPNNIEYSDSLIIPPGTALFSFSFNLVGTAHPKKINYAYKLKGLHKDWIYTDATRAEAVFSFLPAGSYTLEIRASDENGQWQRESKTISFGIVVRPPWWQTWWAYSAYCLAVLLLFWLFYRIKLAEKQRQSALELAATKEQLFANISHEFRTPLTLILGPVKVIEDSTDDLQIKHNTGLITRNAKRLLSMVDQLLQLAQLKEQQKERESAQQVSAVFHFIMNSFEISAQEKRLKLEFDNSIDESWWVRGTKNALETILSNLIANAIKYTDAQGRVSVTVSEKTHGIEFTVSDTGCGIALKEQQRIFERFTRLENSHHLADGVGIGLALVKELVNTLGGEISVKSNVGNGSNFVFTLPKAAPQESLKLATNNTFAEQAVESMALALSSTPSSMTNHALAAVEESKVSILVIEDNQDMREFIVSQLENSYSVLCACDGQQGFKLACEYSPDVILSDVMMPNMDGFQLLNAIRNEIAISHIPVILLTAKGDQQSKLKGLSGLADDYITKPFDVQELLSRIDNLLAIRTILQRRFNDVNLSSGFSPSTNTLEQRIKPISTNDHLTDKEQQFYLRFKSCMNEQYSDSDLSLTIVSNQLAMSDRQLQRKLKAICGSSFSDILRDIRLTQGERLLNKGEQIAVIADQVGFSSSSYFVRCFKAKYGKTPNEYRKAS